jgi:hypothetical protein
MPRVGFEPTIPAFEREKMVHSLDCADTVTGKTHIYEVIYIIITRTFFWLVLHLLPLVCVWFCF